MPYGSTRRLFTAEQIRYIRSLYESGIKPYEISRRLVGPNGRRYHAVQIKNVCTRYTYKEIE